MITKLIISDAQADVLLEHEAQSRSLSVESMLRKDKVTRGFFVPAFFPVGDVDLLLISLTFV